MVVKIEDPKAVATLEAARTPIEIQTADGRYLGRFIPGDESNRMSFPEFGFTDAELERRANDPGVRWYTAEEVMERLRQLQKKA